MSSINSINDYSNNNIAAELSSLLQSSGASALSSSSTSTAASSVTGSASDSSQLSPFAQLLSTLQQMQQSNPTEYQQVTQQIATNLQNAAATAKSNGDTSQANQLSQLATDFTKASTSGQLPNIQDLAQAVGGSSGHHHHHHGGGGSSSSSSSDSSSSSSTSSGSSGASSTSNQALEQILAAFQSLSSQNSSSSSQNGSLNPMSIIMNTLTQAGITSSTNG